jgi:hypothetical protein
MSISINELQYEWSICNWERNNLRHVPSSFTTTSNCTGPPPPWTGARTSKHSSSDTLEKQNITEASLPSAFMSKSWRRRARRWRDLYSQLSCCIKQSFECNVLLQPVAIDCQRQRLRRGCPWREGLMPSEYIFLRKVLNICHLRVV